MQVVSLSEVADSKRHGGKAANLGKLIRASLPVPSGIAIGLDAFLNDGTLANEAKQLIQQFLEDDTLYAVRSSALAEDAEGASWAGQFETFLDIRAKDVVGKVEECHYSAKARAKAYANEQSSSSMFDIAVVVQEMLKPEYAGVLFTKDPVTGQKQPVTEYISGLGEALVSGKADPKRLVLDGSDSEAPFDTTELADLAGKVERLFGVPQDIEWVWANNQIWLVQARPITAIQKTRFNLNLGEPKDLFYWGPSRAVPMYMSDFMAAIEKIFKQMVDDPDLPTPPKNLVLFDEGKMVWLSNADDFFGWCEKVFETYKRLNQLDSDIAKWKAESEKLARLSGKTFNEAATTAWYYTEFAEFALYGSEAALAKQLGRFDAATRQEIWSTFTVPDKPAFLTRIDKKLVETHAPAIMASNYPWIQDGYHGLSDNAQQYFENRLKIVGDEIHQTQDYEPKRKALITTLGLSQEDVSALTLARRLAEFMDDRKAWMMQTRRLIKQLVCNIEHGWFFDGSTVMLIDENDTHELWQRYVDFKTVTNAVVGIVASNGGKHFMNGEVAIVTDPNDIVDDGKIIVAPSTSPSYVPLMRRAKALVTDHGGMMSHAAIVAREFNLPCIVGTKQATKLLQNGNKIVLDLVKGEIYR